ncbi:hypothetical protein MBANPS3_011337 [Mucor bainieri]
MKLDEKRSIEEQIYLEEEDAVQHQHRWMWVRRFILSIILITCCVQSFYHVSQDKEDVLLTATTTLDSDRKSHIVLHTGFPPTQEISGLLIENGKAAATAFSPNPSNTNKQIDMKHMKSNDESWWDRLFPNRHVHLVSVQLPVIGENTNFVNATLSVCASKRLRFGPNSPQVPDLSKCVKSASVQTQDVDEEDPFGVLEWTPDTTIVLTKAKMYWLVVQTPSAPFQWVYAEGGSNKYGTAYETEVGWEFKLEGQPIPSAMLIVEDHKQRT